MEGKWDWPWGEKLGPVPETEEGNHLLSESLPSRQEHLWWRDLKRQENEWWLQSVLCSCLFRLPWAWADLQGLCPAPFSRRWFPGLSCPSLSAQYLQTNSYENTTVFFKEELRGGRDHKCFSGDFIVIMIRFFPPEFLCLLLNFSLLNILCTQIYINLYKS